MMNPMQLNGRRILVTGASSGIGRETAVLLSQLGAQLILVGRNLEQLERTHSLLDGTGHQVCPFDLSGVDAIQGWMKDIAAKVGSLYGLVHSAGMQFTSPLRIASSCDVEALMRVNLTAALFLTKAFRPRGVAEKGGGIVFVSSVTGMAGQAGLAAYSASKGALIALTKSLAVELVQDGIRVNCVAPGMVDTDMSTKMLRALTPEQVAKVKAMHPLGIGRPRDVANAIAFLLAETSRWITGTTIVVDGGYTAQ